MRRRDLLAIGIGGTASFVLRRALGQTPAKATRGAVVIGVDKAGKMPVLRAAASGARAVGKWLDGEDFEVKLFVDDTKPVAAEDIFHAVSAFVSRGTLQQLVV
jgi:hypothetical protein